MYIWKRNEKYTSTAQSPNDETSMSILDFFSKKKKEFKNLVFRIKKPTCYIHFLRHNQGVVIFYFETGLRITAVSCV